MIIRKKSRVGALQDEQGIWVDDQVRVKEMAGEYFYKLKQKDQEVAQFQD